MYPAHDVCVSAPFRPNETRWVRNVALFWSTLLLFGSHTVLTLQVPGVELAQLSSKFLKTFPRWTQLSPAFWIPRLTSFTISSGNSTEVQPRSKFHFVASVSQWLGDPKSTKGPLQWVFSRLRRVRRV